jgi:hypothetical protein
MKTFLPVVILLLVLATSIGSSILFQNGSYTFSAVLTVTSFAGITLLIGVRGVKKEQAK